ncbi:MAG: MBOAT family protein [Planctomycetota bacterium]
MIFSTPFFVLVFFPVVLGGSFLVARSRNARLGLLVVASLVFYGWWDVRLVPLLVGSAAANWFFAEAFRRTRRPTWLVVGVVFDLAVLAFFKYADFLASSLVGALGLSAPAFDIVLPLGISFFTFQQITYLVDLRRGADRFYGFRDFLLFVSWFPQLIAGPIVRHDELIDQFARDPRREAAWENLSRGVVLFLIGLAKKVVLADQIARIGDPLYARALLGETLSFEAGWAAALAFTLQVYFDFSGYSDMAIGMGKMFGFDLPINFEAPYRATSIGDFWRRWHITLSRFLRDYLYIPLGGNRRGRVRQIQNVMVTMLLGGLWHGAGWTYVVWGGLHGVALAVQGGWRRWTSRRLAPVAGWAMTLLFFIFTITLFRAADFPTTGGMWASMVGLNGFASIPGGDVLLLAAGIAVALLGPTSQAVALGSLRPRFWIAATAGAAAVVLLLFMCEGTHPEFIYFQF